eukprot:2476744-Prymnesium_polylepis.1
MASERRASLVTSLVIARLALTVCLARPTGSRLISSSAAEPTATATPAIEYPTTEPIRLARSTVLRPRTSLILPRSSAPPIWPTPYSASRAPTPVAAAPSDLA